MQEDDSDIEFEVDPVPGVSQEVATNVAACVKVRIVRTIVNQKL